ncbi:MAG TPA: 3-hydroxybutyryl-CoA dehydrogenase [Sandaracinaceae bacterium LLY-WYZ-13_1]|nr:3-hydroxybutyryl-CoA dehydrogenase [Sandaracinaceae bacterium LLY-WYZ-13_1]
MAQIEKFGVIGAGQMGRGIAQVAAQSGMEVALLDVDEATAENGLERIAKSLGRLVDKEKIDADTRTAILKRITPTGDYGALSSAQIVVEAATEQLALKRKIFRLADEAIADDAILASNTSSISITKLAAESERPERVVGMHFMNPVPVMKLVELIRALQTSDETYETTRALAERMGKTVITSKDRPGFIVNRMLIPFLNEACFALQEGLGTPEDIDTGAKLGLNHPLGPLALADLIGLDTCLFIAEVLHRELGEDKYRPAAILRNHVAAGWLGRKTGRGFYDYSEK